jgi:hypothetical protein
MATPAGKVPIFESVQAALSFARTQFMAFAPAAAIVALIALAPNVAAAQATVKSDPLGSALAYAALSALGAIFFAAALRAGLQLPGTGPAVLGMRFGADELRLMAAMGVVGFFLFIVFTVGLIPAFALFASALAPFMEELKAAGSDQAAATAILRRAVEANPAIFIGVLAGYMFLWMALTSRLYLAAPATVEDKAVRSFETWAWTKGNMLRIIAARTVLLAPAFFAAGLIQSALAAALGVDSDALPAGLAAWQPNALIVTFISAFASLLLYSLLEAGLSAYLQRGLRPKAS